MRRDGIPTAGQRRYEDAAADSIARQQTITDAASIDALHLLRAGDAVRAGGAVLTYFGATLPRIAAAAAGEVSSIGGATMMVPRTRILRDTARAGDEGVAGAPTTAVTVRGAATHGKPPLTRRDSPGDRGDRP